MGFFEKAKLEKTELEWDRGANRVPGFGVRRNKDGSQNFIAKLSVNGIQRWYTIGPADVISTEAARSLVKQMKLFASNGQDPKDLLISFIKSNGALIETGITFGDYVEIYIRDYAKVYKSSWKKDKQRLELYLSSWWTKRLVDITRNDVEAIHKKIGTSPTQMKNRKRGKGRPYAANRLLETLNSVWAQAIVSNYLPSNHPQWTFKIRRFPEQPRRQKLSKKDMPKIRDAINAHKVPRDRQAFYLIMMMALRHKECRLLKWDYFDFTEMILEIPVTKNGLPHRLPISSAAARLLHSIRRIAGSPWVFPSIKDKMKPVPSFTKAWQKIRSHAQLEHITIHDLRRSAGCFLLKNNKIEMVRDILNHSEEQMSAVYSFYDTDDMVPVLEKHSDEMANFLGFGDSQAL